LSPESKKRKPKRKKARKQESAQRVTYHPEHGPRARTVPLDAGALEALEAQRQLFEAKFGRPPGPSDPIFFDPDADEPVPINEATVERESARLFRGMGLSEAFVFANKTTGVLPCRTNLDLLPPGDFEEFLDAYRQVDPDELGLTSDLDRANRLIDG
jgi:hypothetical protein